MGSVTTHFEPAPNGAIRVRTRFESDDGMVGHSDQLIAPRLEFLGIPWQQLIDAGTGIIDHPEEGPAVIRRVDDRPGGVEAGP